MDEVYVMQVIVWKLILGTHVQVVMCTHGIYGTGMDACIQSWYITCTTVCVIHPMCMCARRHWVIVFRGNQSRVHVEAR